MTSVLMPSRAWLSLKELDFCGHFPELLTVVDLVTILAQPKPALVLGCFRSWAPSWATKNLLSSGLLHNWTQVCFPPQFQRYLLPHVWASNPSYNRTELKKPWKLLQRDRASIILIQTRQNSLLQPKPKIESSSPAPHLRQNQRNSEIVAYLRLYSLF